MSRFVSLLVLALLISTNNALAHSSTVDFGNIETIQAGHYHLHVPLEMDLQGHLLIHSFQNGPGHDDGHGHDDGGHGEGMFTLVFTADSDRIRRTVVRSRLELAVSSWNVPLAAQDAPKYKLVSRRNAFGLGPEFGYGLAAFELLPGKESVFFHRTNCLSSACDEPLLNRFPIDVTHWLQSNEGERMVFSKAAGIHAHLAVGPHFIAALGPIVTFEGTWTTEIEKIETGELKISISRGRMKNTGLELINPVSMAGVIKQWTRVTSFNFLIDPIHSHAAVAYVKLLEGRIDALQEMARSGQGVQFLETGNSRGKSLTTSLQTGVPVLTGIGLESTLQTISSQDSHEVSHVSIQQDLTYSYGRLSRHLLRGRFVVGSTHAEVHDPDCQDDHEHETGDAHLGLTALWIFEKDKLSGERLEKWLTRKGKQYGMPELSQVTIDRSAFGYLRAELRMIFSATLVKTWLGLDAENGSELTLPAKFANSARWKRLKRRASRAYQSEDTRQLSRILAKAGTELVDHFADIRTHAVASKQRLPVSFELRVSGDSVPQTIKAWKVQAAH